MVRIARERISDLFALAEREAMRGEGRRSGRYVALARRIGMRYNVRLLPEYRDLYCRGCSTFWIDGRTVRTRLRSGRRVRTCLVCGRVRRVTVHARAGRGSATVESLPVAAHAEESLTDPIDVEAGNEAGDDEDGPE
jgi:ribonuclease P protein subunit RPR2